MKKRTPSNNHSKLKPETVEFLKKYKRYERDIIFVITALHEGAYINPKNFDKEGYKDALGNCKPIKGSVFSSLNILMKAVENDIDERKRHIDLLETKYKDNEVYIRVAENDIKRLSKTRDLLEWYRFYIELRVTVPKGAKAMQRTFNKKFDVFIKYIKYYLMEYLTIKYNTMTQDNAALIISGVIEKEYGIYEDPKSIQKSHKRLSKEIESIQIQ